MNFILGGSWRYEPQWVASMKYEPHRKGKGSFTDSQRKCKYYAMMNMYGQAICHKYIWINMK